MVTDAEGEIGDALHLSNGASKGKRGGRIVPLNKELRAAKIVEAGGSLRDVQELAGHASLATTQRYIQGDCDAKRRVVDL
jgi:site-specific recombinase XerC